jgi:hypothetical protein
MKKVLALTMVLGLVCASVQAQPVNDECEGALAVACGGSATEDNCLATTGVDDIDLFVNSSCTTGTDFGSIFFSFVATGTAARVSTCNSTTGVDSSYVIWEVDQGNICDETMWVEVGCSEDDGCGPIGFNGDTCATGLTPGNTYIVHLVSWDGGSCGSYTVDLDCNDAMVACCDDLVGACTDELPCDCIAAGNRPGAATTSCGAGDIDPPCLPPVVPTVSEWGLIVMTLIGLTAGTILFSRRRVAVA